MDKRLDSKLMVAGLTIKQGEEHAIAESTQVLGSLWSVESKLGSWSVRYRRGNRRNGRRQTRSLTRSLGGLQRAASLRAWKKREARRATQI